MPPTTPQPVPSTKQTEEHGGVNLFYLLLAILFALANLFAYIVWWPTDAPKPVGVVSAPTTITEQIEPVVLAIEASSTASSSLPIIQSTSTVFAEIKTEATSSASKPASKAAASKPVSTSDRLSPTTPGNLIVRSVSYNQAVISWSPSTDNRGVAGYAIYQDSELIGTTVKTIQGFIRLSSKTKYTFGVSAFDSAGNFSSINNILVTTTEKPAPITVAPSPAPSPTPISPLAPASPPPPAVPSLCGNGTQDRGEQCDDGNASNNDDCTNQCKAAYCTDGYVNYAREQCDDGNEYDNDYCDNQCHNHVPVLPAGTPPPASPSPSPTPGSSPTPSPSPSPTPTPSPSPSPTPSPSNPTTYTINVTSAGNYSQTSITLKVGDSIKFVYTPPIAGEVVTTFSPSTISSVTLDSEFKNRTKTFMTAGSWTFKAKDHSGNTVTLTVQ